MFEAFVAGLLLVSISELGDKTFFIAVILATRHSRRWVFSGVVTALIAMTVLSVLLGQAASFMPEQYIRYAEIALFFGFGVKLLIQGARMEAHAHPEGCDEAMAVLSTQTFLPSQPSNFGIALQAFWLTFLAEWGDRTQITTIGLSASNNAWGIAVGAVLGHAICAAIAVIGGKLIAGRISDKTITLIGGSLFVLFALLALVQLES